MSGGAAFMVDYEQDDNVLAPQPDLGVNASANENLVPLNNDGSTTIQEQQQHEAVRAPESAPSEADMSVSSNGGSDGDAMPSRALPQSAPGGGGVGGDGGRSNFHGLTPGRPSSRGGIVVSDNSAMPGASCGVSHLDKSPAGATLIGEKKVTFGGGADSRQPSTRVSNVERWMAGPDDEGVPISRTSVIKLSFSSFDASWFLSSPMAGTARVSARSPLNCRACTCA